MSDETKKPEIGATSKDVAPSLPKREFTLPFGYPDFEDKTKLHKRVVIGKRPVAKDFFFDAGDSNVQFDSMTQVASITAFGDMKMPVPLTVILSLNQIDRETLKSELLGFMTDTLGDRKNSHLENGKVQLAFGINCNGVVYDVVTFGQLLTGYDEIEIEKNNTSLWQKHLMTMAKEVVLLSQSNGNAERSGCATIEEFETIDFIDLALLKEAEENWLNSFRG